MQAIVSVTRRAVPTRDLVGDEAGLGCTDREQVEGTTLWGAPAVSRVLPLLRAAYPLTDPYELPLRLSAATS
jgi:hypothetical protein